MATPIVHLADINLYVVIFRQLHSRASITNNTPSPSTRASIGDLWSITGKSFLFRINHASQRRSFPRAPYTSKSTANRNRRVASPMCIIRTALQALEWMWLYIIYKATTFLEILYGVEQYYSVNYVIWLGLSQPENRRSSPPPGRHLSSRSPTPVDQIQANPSEQAPRRETTSTYGCSFTLYTLQHKKNPANSCWHAV